MAGGPARRAPAPFRPPGAVRNVGGMAAGNRKLRYALDEARILVLGSQVLLGFEYRAFLEARFEGLPDWARAAKLAALCVMLVAFAILLSPAAYHRIAADGEDRPDVLRLSTVALDLALLPIGLALGLDVAIAVLPVLGARGAAAAGLAAAAVALGAWYGVTSRRAAARPSPPEPEMEPARLSEKIDQVLTETRMALPGAQALLGFQLAGTLVEPFAALPRTSQLVHVSALGAVTLAVILLVLPAAYHRIAERGEETERFLRVASGLLLAGLGAVALGLSADLYVVARKVLHGVGPAVAAAAGALVLFAAAWFGLPLAARGRRRRAPGVPGPPRPAAAHPR